MIINGMEGVGDGMEGSGSTDLTWLFNEGHLTFEGPVGPSCLITNTGDAYQQLFNTPTNPSPSSSSLHQPHATGLPSNAVPSSSKKRRRTAKIDDSNHDRAYGDALTTHAVLQITDAVPIGHPLRSVRTTGCSGADCFAMSPLGEEPSDYYRRPFRFAKFSVQIFDSSAPPSEVKYHSVGTFSRTAGRSIHLIVTKLPLLDDVRKLDIGFALIVACRKVHGTWQPACLVSFESSAEHKSRARSTEIGFRGNLEHCTSENGRRIWGQRSSHVRRAQKTESFKPLRIIPKGPVGLNMPEDFSFHVGLFNADGFLLRHVDGTPCIAQTNTVRFEPSRKGQNEGAASALMREINKLSLFERADLSTLPTIPEKLRTMLITTDEHMLARVGVRMFDAENKPATSVELSKFYDAYDADKSQLYEQAYRSRVRAVAFELGFRHADPGLTDSTKRFLALGSTEAVEVRYQQIQSAGLQEALDWLNENGIHEPSMATIVERAELAGFLMRDLRFQSSWTVGINNVYPDRILVDGERDDKVHCLANTTYEADIALRDRMASLARFAFCTKLKRDQLHEDILTPYARGFLSRFPSTDEPNGHQSTGQATSAAVDDLLSSKIATPFAGTLVDRDKFDIVLHLYHMDFFMYWIRFRSATSVRRLAERLLEDDKQMDQWFFQPGRLSHFRVSTSGAHRLDKNVEKNAGTSNQ